MNREEGKFVVSQCIGAIDDRFIVEATQHKTKKKKKFPLPAVACLVLLCGGFYTTRDIQVYHLGAGYTFTTWNALDGSRGHQTRNPTDEKYQVLERRDGKIYYIFEDNDLDISNFCSLNEYISDFNLDKEGTGFVLTVGGNADQAGYSIYFYENGQYIFGNYEFFEYIPSENWFNCVLSGSPYPRVELEFAEEQGLNLREVGNAPWHTHANSQFLKDIPEEYWGNYPEMLSFYSGQGAKIGETMYHFEVLN